MNKKDKAKTIYDSGFNCAQSVLKPFADQLDIDVNSAMKLASGFGAGMGRTQGTCGALTGAYMVLGLKYGEYAPDDDSTDDVIEKIQQLTREFEDEHGFTNCRDLLNVDLKTDEGQKEFDAKNLHNTVCSLCVNSTVSFLEDIIDKK